MEIAVSTSRKKSEMFLPLSASLILINQRSTENQEFITLAETSTIEQVLSKLSTKTRILTASKTLKDQRVSVFLRNTEKQKAENILLRVLGHSIDTPTSYEWHQGVDKNTFILTRNLHDKKEERNLLEYPKRQIALILKNTRDNLNSDKEIVYGTNTFSSGFELHNNILKSLTDSQLETLISGKGISVSQFVPKNLVDNYQKMYSKNFQDSIANGIAFSQEQKKGPYKEPMITVKPQRGSSFLYTISIAGAINHLPAQGIWNDNGQIIDPFQSCTNPLSPLSTFLPEKMQKIPNEKQYDFSELYKDKNITSTMRSDLGFLLGYISKTTNIDIVSENFISRGYFTYPHKFEFQLKKGTLREIFEYIWRNYNYITEQNEGVYYIWSPVWAFERRADIPDRELEYWKKLKEKQNGFTLEQWIKVASKYNDYQLRDTFYQEIPMSPAPGQGNGLTTVSFELLRFLGKLSPEIWQDLRERGEIKWQDLPLDLRSSLNYSSMEDIKWFDQPVELTYSELMNCTGALHYSKSLRGQDSEMVVLNVNTQDGANVFSFSVSGIILPKKR